MADKIKFKIVNENFNDLIVKLKDLTTISKDIKMKIDEEDTLIYSTLGGNVMLAFKSYLLKTSDYFETKQNMEFTYDVVLANCDKLVKNLDFLANEEKITLDISYKESPEDNTIMNARNIKFTGGKLKVNWLAGERYEIRDINKGVLKQRLNVKDRKWSFTLTNSQFANVKKL